MSNVCQSAGNMRRVMYQRRHPPDASRDIDLCCTAASLLNAQTAGQYQPGYFHAITSGNGASA
jgi:hypothetical protein